MIPPAIANSRMVTPAISKKLGAPDAGDSRIPSFDVFGVELAAAFAFTVFIAVFVAFT